MNPTTQTKADPLARPFSVFATCKKLTPQGKTTLEKLVKAIRSGKWRDQVEQCRQALRERGEDAYNELRERIIPAVTLCATVATRAKDASDEERQAKFSGLLQIDVDDVGDDLTRIRRIIEEAPFIAFCSRSLGNGLKAVARIPASRQAIPGAWHAAKGYFAERGVILDEAPKSPWSLCFVSYDPDAYFNPDATELEPIEIPPDAKGGGGEDVPDEEATEPTETILERLRARPHVLELLRGEWEGKTYLSQSEADFSLGCSICEETSNHDQQGVIFSDSGLYRNDRKMNLALKAARKRVRQQHNEWLALLPALPGEEDDGDEPFPLDCLPPTAERMAREIARVSTSQNEPLAAISVLGVLSASLGAGLELPTEAGKTVRGNLYLLAVAESGLGKGESSGPATAPLGDYEAELLAKWNREQRPALTSKQSFLQRKAKKLLSVAEKPGQDEECSLLQHVETEKELAEIERMLAAPPKLQVGDATKEALQKAIATQPGEALASISAEARGVVAVLQGRYSQGGGKASAGDEDFYTSAYSGDRISIDRVGRGAVSLKRPCLTILWMVQPDAADGLFRDEAMMVSGLVARFLLFDSQAEPMERETPPEPISPEAVESWAGLIRALLDSYRMNGDDPQTVEIEAEAARTLFAFGQETIRRRRKSGDLHDVPSLVARWAENAYRLALVLHAGRWSDKAHKKTVTVETAKAAIRLQRWFATKQLALLSRHRREKRQKRLLSLLALLAEGAGEISLRDLGRSHGFPEEEVRRLAEAFPTKLTVEKRETGGRPSTVARKL